MPTALQQELATLLAQRQVAQMRGRSFPNVESRIQQLQALVAAEAAQEAARKAEQERVRSAMNPVVRAALEHGEAIRTVQKQLVGMGRSGNSLETRAQRLEAGAAGGEEMARAALEAEQKEGERIELERAIKDKKRKFGVFGPSWTSHGTPRMETMLEQGSRHHPILGSLASSIAAPALGMLAAGPAGALAAGAGYGALEHGKEGIPMGAVKGGIFAATAPTMAESAGVVPSTEAAMVTPEMMLQGAPAPTSAVNDVLANLSGLNSPSLLHQLGVTSAPSIGGGIGLWANATPYLGPGEAGLLDKLIPYSAANAAKSVLESGGRIWDIIQRNRDARREFPGGVTETFEPAKFLGSDFSANPIGIPSENIDVNLPITSRSLADFIPEGFLNSGKKSLYQQLKKYSPLGKSKKTRKLKPPLKFKGGGSLDESPQRLQSPINLDKGGYIHGFSSGTTDDVPTYLPEGSYVMDATTVSLLGNGNSNNGAKKLDAIKDRFYHSGITSYDDSGHHIKALVSDGEYVMPKQVVDAIGKGDNKKGAAYFDKFRRNLRKQKGVKTFLPPKSKPLENYVRK